MLAPQEDDNATQSSAYSVKLAPCFNWKRAKQRRMCIGTAALFCLLPEVSMVRSASAQPKTERGSNLLDRPRPSKHLPQYGSRNTLCALDNVVRSELRHAL